jgi:hypothetical protein
MELRLPFSDLYTIYTTFSVILLLYSSPCVSTSFFALLALLSTGPAAAVLFDQQEVLANKMDTFFGLFLLCTWIGVATLAAVITPPPRNLNFRPFPLTEMARQHVSNHRLDIHDNRQTSKKNKPVTCFKNKIK